VVSARSVQRGAETPLLDAIAHGRREQRLIFNRDPGVDSLVELLPGLRDGADGQELRLLGGLCEQISDHNVGQLRGERSAIGFAHTLVSDLHALELTGDSGLLGVREIAMRVRGALTVLLDERASRLEVVDAVRAVDAVLAAAPRAQIFSASLASMLGGRQFRLLEQLDARRRSRWS
jgi:hypothetical protein